MPIHVYSFDVDGCLFNNRFLDDPDKNLITANQTLLDQIKEQTGQKYVLCGSSRQSAIDDHYNCMYGKGSALPRLTKIAEYTGSCLVPLLLADLYNQRDPGSCWRDALSLLNPEYQYTQGERILQQLPNWFHDESKLSILYAQMHYMARQHRDSDIVFHFYDDRADILEKLQAWFGNATPKIPARVSLMLHRYDGNQPELVARINGSGAIDPDMTATLVHMAKRTIRGAFCAGREITAQTGVVFNYEKAREFNFNCSAVRFTDYVSPDSLNHGPGQQFFERPALSRGSQLQIGGSRRAGTPR